MPKGSPAGWSDPATNLLARALAAGCEAGGGGPPSGLVRVTAPIPLARGLGSSAAAVVAGLGAASACCGGRLSADRILSLATAIEGHPDNAAAALLGGLAVTVRDGDGQPTARHVPAPTGLEAVLFVPDRELATRAARAVLPVAVPLADAVFNAGRCALLVHAFCSGDLPCLGLALEDRWHQPARARLLPWMPELIAAARAAGAYGACLSGAGPAVLALTASRPGPRRAVSQALTTAAARAGVGGAVRVLALAPRGMVTEPLPPRRPGDRR